MLKWVELNDDAPSRGFPWELPMLPGLRPMRLERAVTFFVGENGSGKSTLIEAIADPGGGTRNLRFDLVPTESALADHLTMAWDRRPQRSFFLRSETFFQMATAYREVLDARDPLSRLHSRSHGEQFLDAVVGRSGPDGFFVMDEPESALSLTGQMALMALMRQAIGAGGQFVIATHSPVLLTFPGASIKLFSDAGIEDVALEDAPPFRDTRSFLNDPALYLTHLFEEE